MDNSFDPQESDAQRPRTSLSGLQFFDGILNWLIGFIRLTDEEEMDAGIYLGDQHDKEWPVK